MADPKPSEELCKLIADVDKAVGQNPQPKSAIVNCPKMQMLDYKIKLGKNRILTPLEIPDFKELSSGTTKNTEKVDFVITSRRSVADSLVIEVLDGNNVIFSDTNTATYLPNGDHTWQWDGYDTSGVLDTKVLKSKDLKVRLTAKKGSNQEVSELKLSNKAEKADWVDAKIDRNNNTAEITVRPSFSDGGDWDPEAERAEQLGAFAGTSLRPKFKSTPYADLLKMAKAGIEKYWTRDGSRANGTNPPVNTAQGVFALKVTADMNANGESRASNFQLRESLTEEYSRSTSLRGIRVVYHNTGYWNSRGQPNNADPQFEYTAAHEFGHLILDVYGAGSSPDYSWSHKGTSSVISQSPLPGTSYPATGEVDLMKYAKSKLPYSYVTLWDRSVAAEEDAKGLIWLTRVEFK